MNLSELCIRRPVMVVLLSLSLVLVGILSYMKIPVAALPSYNTPVINVSANLPGASPETMASSVARATAGRACRARSPPGFRAMPWAGRWARRWARRVRD